MMASEPEGFEVGFNEAMNEWYVVHRRMKGNVLHRDILIDRYESEEVAQKAAEALSGKI